MRVSYFFFGEKIFCGSEFLLFYITISFIFVQQMTRVSYQFCFHFKKVMLKIKDCKHKFFSKVVNAADNCVML